MSSNLILAILTLLNKHLFNEKIDLRKHELVLIMKFYLIFGVLLLLGTSITCLTFSALITVNWNDVKYNWYSGQINVTKDNQLIKDETNQSGEIYVDGLVNVSNSIKILKLHVIYPPRPQFLYNYNRNTLAWYNNLVINGLNNVSVNPLKEEDVYEAVTELPIISHFVIYLLGGIVHLIVAVVILVMIIRDYRY